MKRPQGKNLYFTLSIEPWFSTHPVDPGKVSSVLPPSFPRKVGTKYIRYSVVQESHPVKPLKVADLMSESCHYAPSVVYIPFIVITTVGLCISSVW